MRPRAGWKLPYRANLYPRRGPESAGIPALVIAPILLLNSWHFTEFVKGNLIAIAVVGFVPGPKIIHCESMALGALALHAET